MVNWGWAWVVQARLEGWWHNQPEQQRAVVVILGAWMVMVRLLWMQCLTLFSMLVMLLCSLVVAVVVLLVVRVRE